MLNNLVMFLSGWGGEKWYEMWWYEGDLMGGWRILWNYVIAFDCWDVNVMVQGWVSSNKWSNCVLENARKLGSV